MQATDTIIEARLVRRPATNPEWTPERLASSLDVRRFVDGVKKRLDAKGWVYEYLDGGGANWMEPVSEQQYRR